MSTSNKNNNKSSNNNSVNTFHEFMPYWSNEEACYKEAIIKVETLGNTTETRTWPRIKPVEQIVYEGFMSKIKNPVNGQFFPQRDKEGVPMEQPNGQPNAKYVIKNITRYRKATGEEYLYSQGEIQGFNSLGSPVSLSINECENWNKPKFDTERKFNPKTNSIEDITKGVTGVEKIYELPFSKENVDRLYSMAVGVNGNKMHNNRHHNVNLVLKEEQSGIAMQVMWSSLEKSLELFRDKDFLYLWHTEYIPDTLKRELREKSEALTDNKPIEVPTLDKPDNKNYKGYTL